MPNLAGLEHELFEYWAHFYRDLLGLPNWEEKARYRLQEDQTALRQIEHMEAFTGLTLAPQQKILVVGGGTGAEFMALAQRGCEVYAVEPDLPAVRIAHQKAKSVQVPAENFLQSVGETLPFPDNTFDWVWCWSVLEHVQDVEQCLDEMIRVIQPSGRIFIQTHDYRQFYEGHYKLPLPMFLPKWLLKLILRWHKRPTDFLDTLQFVNQRQFANYFQKQGVVAQFILFPWESSRQDYPWDGRWVSWMRRKLGIQRDQTWLIYKLPSLNG